MIKVTYSLKKDYPRWSGAYLFQDKIFENGILQEVIDNILKYIEKEEKDEVIKWEIADNLGEEVKTCSIEKNLIN